MIRKLLILIGIALPVLGCAQERVIRLSADDGTTIEEAVLKARQMRQKGQGHVTIQLSEGDFLLERTLNLTPQDSGLTIRGKGMGKTRLVGAIQLPGFQEGGNGLWTMDLSRVLTMGEEIGQLFVNGQRATKARTPNLGTYFMTEKVDETILDTVPDRSALRTGLAAHRLQLQPQAVEALRQVDVRAPGQMKVWFLHAWDITRRHVFSIDLDKGALYSIGQGQKSWNRLSNTSQYMLEDDMSFLDEPGEFFYDQDQLMLYYMPLEGQEITTAKAVIPTVRQAVVIRGGDQEPVSNVTFRDLSILYTRYTMPWRGNEPQQAAAGTDAAVMVDCARDIQFENVEIAHTGNNGIWMRRAVRDSGLRNCHLHDLGIGAVKIGEMAIPKDEDLLLTRGVTVDNCILTGGGSVFPTGVGVTLFQTSDNRITHNEISDFYYSGVSVGWIWGYSHSPSKRNKILYNHIHHIGWGVLSDMGGVYTLGLSEGTEVSHNVIHDIYSLGYGGWGLYPDEGSTGVRMEYNLVWNCKSSAFHQHYGQDNIIRNNVFAGQIRAQLEATRVEDHNSFDFTQNIVLYSQGDMYGKQWKDVRFRSERNLYWNTGGTVSFNGLSLEQWQKETGKDAGSICQDPGLQDRFRDSGKLEMTNREALDAIGFEMFDPTEAGVYGSEDWKEKARMDPERAALYERNVQWYEEHIHR